MAVTLNKANLVLKDANGNIGKIEQLSSNDLAKIRTAVSDVALVVNQSNHTPIEATTTNKGVVQLATSADVVAGASNKVVTANQLHNVTAQMPGVATNTTVGVVKPDGTTITVDGYGTLTCGVKTIAPVTGKIEWFAFSTAPNGYLVCNGANVSRTTYADLFAAIGTTFGSGDGSTTFALPNLINKFAQGSTTAGTVYEAGLPNITGFATDVYFGTNYSSLGALTLTSTQKMLPWGDAQNTGILDFNASRSNTIYGNSTTVQPPALALLPCIKY